MMDQILYLYPKLRVSLGIVCSNFRAVTSHLQTCGCTLIVGMRRDLVNLVSSIDIFCFQFISDYVPFDCFLDSYVLMLLLIATTFENAAST